MGKNGTVRALAVFFEVLRYNCSDSHSNSNKTVVVDTDPDNIKPGQTTLRSSPRSPTPATCFGKPIHWPYPRFYRAHMSKEFLLFMQIRCYIMAQESKERSNCEGFVAVADNLEVDGMPIVVYTQESRRSIYRNHEQDADNAG